MIWRMLGIPHDITLFQMLGNFSFGDYFKDTAITLAWELLTDVYRLDPKRLIVTVYDDDEETYRIWRSKIGISDSRILKIGDNKGGRYSSDNFWQMADTGPCGPCTEIFFDYGPTVKGDLPGTTNEGDRFIEIWNLYLCNFIKTRKEESRNFLTSAWIPGWGWREFLQFFKGLQITIKPIPFTI